MDNRYRTFATIVYPESAPDGWLDLLSQTFVQAYVSPLHDKDINPTGELKKAHYHVLLHYEGKKSLEQVIETVSVFGGVQPQVVQSLRGYARYLCHLDNPEKVQYAPADVRCFSGADYMATIGLATDKYQALREMTIWCIEHDVSYFSDLWEYAMQERMDWFRILSDCGTIPIKEWLKSRKYKVDNLRKL